MLFHDCRHLWDEAEGGGCMNEQALNRIGYGLYVVSSRSGDRLNGQIVNALIQTTCVPLTIAVSIHKENFTHQCIEESGVFSASILSDDADMRFIGTFGFRDGRTVDKFAERRHIIGTTKAPVVLDHTLAYLEARVLNRLELSTHTLFVGTVVEAEVVAEGTPMTYAYYHEVKKGKTPKRAVTYRPGLHGDASR
jgi:ferric-chelate reductase [NAD(P)H]